MNKIKNLILASLAFLLVSCSNQNDEDLWVVGTSADNPPYEFIKNGEVQGFDIDLIKAIAKHADKKIEIKNMEFHGLIAALNSKNVEMVVAGMSVTEERLKKIDFSIPYTEADITVLTRKEDGIEKPGDLTGKILGSQLGTIWAITAYDLSVEHKFETKNLSNNLILVEELKQKRIDGVVLEGFQAEEFIKKNPQLSSFKIKGKDSDFAIALPKSSKDKELVDEAIKALKADGTIAELSKKWGIN